MTNNQSPTSEFYNVEKESKKTLDEMYQFVKEQQSAPDANPAAKAFDLEQIMKSPISTFDKSTVLATVGLEIIQDHAKKESLIAYQLKIQLMMHFKRLHYLSKKHRRGRVSAASAPKDEIPNTYRVNDAEILEMIEKTKMKFDEPVSYTKIIDLMSLPHNKIAYQKFNDHFHAFVEYSINHIGNAMVEAGLVKEQPIEMQQDIIETIKNRDSLPEQYKKEVQFLQSSGEQITGEKAELLDAKFEHKSKFNAVMNQNIASKKIGNTILEANPDAKNVNRTTEKLMSKQKGPDGLSLNQGFEHQQNTEIAAFKDAAGNRGDNLANIYEEATDHFKNPPVCWAHGNSDPRLEKEQTHEPEQVPTEEGPTAG